MSNARFSILQAVAVSDRRVSDAQFRTLAALGMYADKNGWCFPSLKTLAADLKKSPQAVGRDTIALRKLGYLEVKNRYDSKTKSRHSNLYRLKYDLPDFNVGDTPLSTPEVDTLSTSDVDVNDPLNAPKESFFTAKEKEQNETKWQELMKREAEAQSRIDSGTGWRGRELLPPDYLIYGDWWHEKTGLHMYGAKSKAKADSGWLKAFKELFENEVTIQSCNEALESNKWRNVSNPLQIVNDAKAVQAAPAKATQIQTLEDSGWK